MILFALATFSPAALILAAILWGGLWAWLAAGFVTLLAFSLDRLVPEEIANADPEAEFPASTPLLIALGAVHLALLPAGVWAVGGNSGRTLVQARLRIGPNGSARYTKRGIGFGLCRDWG